MSGCPFPRFRVPGHPYGLTYALSTLRLSCSRLPRLRHRRKTRYGWVANPYPAGAFTQQNTSSFSWSDNAKTNGRPAFWPVRVKREVRLYTAKIPTQLGSFSDFSHKYVVTYSQSVATEHRALLNACIMFMGTFRDQKLMQEATIREVSLAQQRQPVTGAAQVKRHGSRQSTWQPKNRSVFYPTRFVCRVACVGTPVTRRPPGRRRRSPPGSHRTWRADLPHYALEALIHSTAPRGHAEPLNLEQLTHAA